MAKRQFKPREVLLIAAAVVIVVGGLGQVLFLKPFLNRFDATERALSKASKQLLQAEQWRDEILGGQSGQEALGQIVAKRGPFDLYGFIRGTLGAKGVLDRATLSQGRDFEHFDQVTLQLQGVRLEEIVDILHVIYAANKLIMVDAIQHIQPARGGENGLECQLTLISPKA